MYFDLWATLGALLPEDPRIALFLAVLTGTTAVSGKLISAMLKESGGRAEIWFALSDRTLESKVRRVSRWLLWRVSCFGPRVLGVRVARPAPRIADGMIATCLLLVSVGPSLSTLFGQTAAWGAGTFSYPAGWPFLPDNFPDGIPSPEMHGLLLTSAIVSALCLVLPLRVAWAISLFSVVMLAVNLHYFSFGWYSNRYTVFTIAVVAIGLTGALRSGLAALLATAFLLSLSFVFSTRNITNIEATAPLWLELVALGAAIGAGTYAAKSRAAALTILPPALAVSVYLILPIYEGEAALLPAFLSALANPFLVYATLAIVAAFFVTRFVRRWHPVALSALLLGSGLGLHQMVSYSSSVVNWGDVLKVVQYILFIPTLAAAALISLTLSFTLARIGLLRLRPLRFGLTDVLVSTAALYALLAGFAVLASSFEVRDGATYLRYDDIVAGISGAERTMVWVVGVCLIITLPSAVHLMATVFALSALLPARLKTLVVRALEHQERHSLGVETLVAGTVLVTWVSFFTAAALMVVMGVVYVVSGELVELSALIGEGL